MSENSNGSGDMSGNILRGRVMVYRFGGDVCFGLYVLIVGIDIFVGWMRL